MSLRPEQRMDRNGKLVTRHIRDSTAPVKRSAIPAPKAPTHAQKVREVAYLLDANGRLGAARKSVVALSAEQLQRVKEAATRCNESAPDFKEMIRLSLKVGKTDEVTKIIDTVLEGETRGSTRSSYLMLMGMLGKNHGARNYVIDDDKEEFVRAYVRVGAAILDTSGMNHDQTPLRKNVMGHVYIQEGEFMDLLEERAADADRIRLIIEDRKTTDPEIIRSVLNSNSMSLSDGVL